MTGINGLPPRGSWDAVVEAENSGNVVRVTAAICDYIEAFEGQSFIRLNYAFVESTV